MLPPITSGVLYILALRNLEARAAQPTPFFSINPLITTHRFYRPHLKSRLNL